MWVLLYSKEGVVSTDIIPALGQDLGGGKVLKGAESVEEGVPLCPLLLPLLLLLCRWMLIQGLLLLLLGLMVLGLLLLLLLLLLGLLVLGLLPPPLLLLQ